MIILTQEEVLSWYSGEIYGQPSAALAGLVPHSFPAFARVMNPVRTSKGQRLRWSVIASSSMTVDSETQWSEIVSMVNPDPNEYYEPETGTIDSSVALGLSAVLAEHTQSSAFTFLAWEGYDSLLEEVRESPTITIGEQRVMHVRNGSIELALKPIDFPPTRLAMNWIPDDAAWFVGNDIYARSVFVGGSVAAVAAVLSAPGLEAYLVRPGQTVVPED